MGLTGSVINRPTLSKWVSTRGVNLLIFILPTQSMTRIKKKKKKKKKTLFQKNFSIKFPTKYEQLKTYIAKIKFWKKKYSI